VSRGSAELIGSQCSALSLGGEARPDSDLDLLVDFVPGASLLDHVGLFHDLEELLGVEVNVITRNALKLRDDRIRSQAVDL
jgi:uncharacterized protein